MKTPQLGHDVQAGRTVVRHERGVALIFTLLILALLMVLSLGMVIAISSQTFIAGYYRNFRGAFYAADSGTNIVRQYMLNAILADVPTTFSSTSTSPIPTGSDATIQTNVSSTYGSWTSLNSGQAANSWPEQFKVSAATFALITSPAQPVLGTDHVGNKTYQYTYNYSTTSLGQVKGNEQASVTDSGSLIILVDSGTPAGVVTSFASWGMFIDQAAECDGTTLVPGTITGPVFTNGGFTFSSAGTYVFTDPVGFGDATAGYQNASGTCVTTTPASPWSQAVGSGSSKQTIAPSFIQPNGLNLSQNPVTLPANSLSQERAVLDGMGTSSATVTTAQLSAGLLLANSTEAAYAGSSTADVYLPYTTATTSACPTPPCMTGGGIYVEGNAKTIQLAATTGASPGKHSLQVITITQGSTTTTITEDLTAQTTTMKGASGTSVVINGLPEDYNNIPPTPATMLFVDGSIGTSSTTGLSGPGQGVAGIQNNMAMTITATGSINVTGDVIYATEPVTTTQNQSVSYATTTCCTGAADTLIPLPASESTQVLGIFTATGNVNLYNQQSNGNLEIDAAIATLSAGGSGGITNPGNSINTLNIVGGRMQNTIQSINSTTRNVYFDRRFGVNGFAPPWFPSTTITPTGVLGATSSYSIQRVLWLNNNATLN